MSTCKNIVIAGASGYIGRAIIPKLRQRFPEAHITALSRSQQKSTDAQVEWKACDLFSLKSLESALPAQVDLAYYFVHSMAATAHLDQGSFADYDLILADNFSRALRKTGLQHLIYLGGLIPDEKDLSMHLRSRLEVEEVFEQFNFPRTTFRAGLILGDGGSSFQILLKLVKRLPIMVCPQWTQNLTTPIDLSSVLEALIEAAMQEKHKNKVYDLAGCQPLTYLQMMKDTAQKLGLKRYFFKVPFFTPTLSALWVSLITGTPKDLVYPLIESLEHEMVPRPNHLFFDRAAERTYFDLLDRASLKTYDSNQLFHFTAQRNTVRSVQRLPLPAGKDAEWVKEEYIRWLPKFSSSFMIVSTNAQDISFAMFSKKLALLVLNFSADRSGKDRQLLYIKKGFLVAENNRGRLEFREVLHRKYILAAIHDYRPSLPWFVYMLTQAQIHLLTMKAFAKRLKRV